MLEEWGAKTFSESPLGELESRKGEERTEAMAPGREKPGLDASRVSQEQGRARETGRVEIKGKEEESCQGPLPRGHLCQRGSLDPKWSPAKYQWTPGTKEASIDG